MPLPTPRKGEKMADFISKFMANKIASKDYGDSKQRYAVGASIFREAKKKQRKSNLQADSTILTPEPSETFAEFLGRFVSDEAMIALFPDSSDRAEIASEIYDNNELEMMNDSESGSDSTPIEPAIPDKKEVNDEEEEEDEEEDEEENLMTSSSGTGAPAGTIPTAVIQGQGGAKKTKYDYEEGNDMTIKGVSVLTAGPAKGHNLQIDSKTLEQVKKCAEQFKGGVKVNENHGAGIGDIIGKLTNFRIDESGNKLLADLTFLKSRQERAKYYMDLASEIPDAFGISISFSGESEQNGHEFDLARCAELYSADLVQHPASNPTGLFSADCGRVTVDKGENINMENKPAEPTDKKETPSYNMEDLGKRMEDLASRLSALEAKMNSDDDSDDDSDDKAEMEATSPVVPEKSDKAEKKDEGKPSTDMSAVEAGKIELSGVLKEIRTELSKMVSSPISHSAPAVDEKKPTTFAELVNFEMKANNISKGEALRLCVGKYTEQYRKELSAGGFNKSF
jgi:hypothetical protein